MGTGWQDRTLILAILLLRFLNSAERSVGSKVDRLCIRSISENPGLPSPSRHYPPDSPSASLPPIARRQNEMTRPSANSQSPNPARSANRPLVAELGTRFTRNRNRLEHNAPPLMIQGASRLPTDRRRSRSSAVNRRNHYQPLSPISRTSTRSRTRRRLSMQTFLSHPGPPYLEKC
jgi:hypothetical protein